MAETRSKFERHMIKTPIHRFYERLMAVPSANNSSELRSSRGDIEPHVKTGHALIFRSRTSRADHIRRARLQVSQLTDQSISCLCSMHRVNASSISEAIDRIVPSTFSDNPLPLTVRQVKQVCDALDQQVQAHDAARLFVPRERARLTTPVPPGRHPTTSPGRIDLGRLENSPGEVPDEVQGEVSPIRPSAGTATSVRPEDGCDRKSLSASLDPGPSEPQTRSRPATLQRHRMSTFSSPDGEYSAHTRPTTPWGRQLLGNLRQAHLPLAKQRNMTDHESANARQKLQDLVRLGEEYQNQGQKTIEQASKIVETAATLVFKLNVSSPTEAFNLALTSPFQNKSSTTARR